MLKCDELGRVRPRQDRLKFVVHLVFKEVRIRLSPKKSSVYRAAQCLVRWTEESSRQRTVSSYLLALTTALASSGGLSAAEQKNKKIGKEEQANQRQKQQHQSSSQPARIPFGRAIQRKKNRKALPVRKCGAVLFSIRHRSVIESIYKQVKQKFKVLKRINRKKE